MNAYMLTARLLALLVLLSEPDTLSAQAAPPINQCRMNWVLSTVQDMNFGAFSADAGVATITMNRFGGRTPSGQVSLSTSIPATAWVVDVNNTLDPACASYGFTLDLRRAPRPLRGTGSDIPLGNIRVTVPAYGLNDVTFPQLIVPGPGNTAPFTMTIYGEITVTNPQTSGLYGRNLAVRITQNNRNHRARTQVQATSIVPLSIAEITVMDFGTIAGGLVPGTVVLGVGNSRIASGDVQLLTSGMATAASFQVSGEPGQAYSISFNNGLLTNAGGDQMSAGSFTSNSSGAIPAGGSELFQIGATLSVGSNQPAGNYSTTNAGGAPYTVTVNYN